MLPLRSRFVAAAVTGVLIGLTGTAHAQESPALTRRTLDQCVSTALARNVEVRIADEDQSLAESQRSGAKGQFGPSLNVAASYQRWNEAYVFSGFPVHDTSVWNVTATITQPITGLFAVYDAYKVRDLGVDIAAVRREAVRRQTALRVVESYYRLLQAERLAEVAVASVDQLNAQLRLANSFHTNGTVSQDDVLRAQLALANAEQRRITANARITLERVHLALYMGVSPNSPIEAEPLPEDQVFARDALSLDQAERTAEIERVELREVDKRIALAGYDRRLANMKLVPQVSLVGAYIHNEGSLFSQINAGYVGALASWDVWDRGATLTGISEAKAHAREAFLARIKVNEQIQLEVTQAYLGVDTASQALTVAQAAVAAAEENFRLVNKRYAAAMATSFDVVDAEALLTQARGQLHTARYDFVIARASLRAAMGAAPDGLARR